jgi:hypothetical protein
MTHPLSEKMRKLAAIDVHQFTFGWGHAKQMQDCLRRAADALEAVSGERDDMRAGSLYVRLKWLRRYVTP